MSRLISTAFVAGIIAISLPIASASARDHHEGHGAHHRHCKKVVKCKGFGHHKRCKKIRICKHRDHH